MSRHLSRTAALSLALAALLAAGLAAPAQDGQNAQPQRHPNPLEPQLKALQNTIDAQRIEIDVLRAELAERQLAANEAQRELAELQKFIEDYQKLGEAFDQYEGLKETAQQEARQQQVSEARARYEQIKAERRERYERARAARQQQRAEDDRLKAYRDAGFTALGLDVYASNFSYYYSTTDATQTRLDYRTGFGHYLRYYPNYEIDYTVMTISGSVLNSGSQTRNIGVAFTFFDEYGTQVGHETIQVANARPDVPYPFTAEVKMALNRPFDSSSAYVLYADPIE